MFNEVTSAMKELEKNKKEDDMGSLVESLKGYLEYLKICGVEEVPLATIPELDTKKRVISEGVPSVKTYKPPFEAKEVRSSESPYETIALEKSSASIEDDAPRMSLDEVRRELGDCQRCKLHAGRMNIVFGTGNPNAELVFVGEGPGQDEDIQGEPFVGRAGQKLTEIIEKGMKLKRKDVYICNIVKCRPPGNRDPKPDEIQSCSPFVIKQLRAINPKVIVALGKPSASTLLGRNVAITRERGTWHQFQGIRLMLTYHPAYLLRQYTPEVRRQVYEDVLQVLDALKK